MTDTDIRVGFIGLGIMGQAMAANILKARLPLTVFNRTSTRAEPLVEMGATMAVTPAEVALASDIVFSCVTDTPDVLEVLLDDFAGLIVGARPGLLVVDCSTVSPQVAQECSAAFAEKGAAFMDAPVSGGDVGAKAGTLSIMVGGRKEDFDRALPVLQTMGKTITYCGPSGSGYVVKLCNQILGGLHLVAAAEALCLAQAAGVDLSAMLQAVSGGAAGSWILSHLAPKMVSGDYRPGFFIDYQLKDLHIAAEVAHLLGTPLPVSALAETLFRSASAHGLGRQGTQAIYEAIRRLGASPDREAPPAGDNP